MVVLQHSEICKEVSRFIYEGKRFLSFILCFYEQYHAFWCGTACGTRTGMIEAME
jgi:hypothetical protein